MRNLTYRRITEEDLQDAPKGSWKGKLLYAINLFFQQMYYGLQNQLTPEENDVCQVKTFQLIGSATASENVYSFATNYTYQPSRMVLGKAVVVNNPTFVWTAAPFISWSFNSGTLNIIGISGLTTGVTYSFTVEIRWAPIVN